MLVSVGTSQADHEGYVFHKPWEQIRLEPLIYGTEYEDNTFQSGRTRERYRVARGRETRDIYKSDAMGGRRGLTPEGRDLRASEAITWAQPQLAVTITIYSQLSILIYCWLEPAQLEPTYLGEFITTITDTLGHSATHGATHLTVA